MPEPNTTNHHRLSRLEAAKAGGICFLCAVCSALFAYSDQNASAFMRGAAALIAFSLLLLAAVMLVILMLPQPIETTIETSAEELRIKFPLRPRIIIAWKQISRVEGIQRGDGPFGDDVSIRIYWNNDRNRITLSDDVARNSGLLSILGSLPEFNVRLRYASQYQPKWYELMGRTFTLFSRDRA
jgi:hypothetical protein